MTLTIDATLAFLSGGKSTPIVFDVCRDNETDIPTIAFNTALAEDEPLFSKAALERLAIVAEAIKAGIGIGDPLMTGGLKGADLQKRIEEEGRLCLWDVLAMQNDRKGNFCGADVIKDLEAIFGLGNITDWKKHFETNELGCCLLLIQHRKEMENLCRSTLAVIHSARALNKACDAGGTSPEPPPASRSFTEAHAGEIKAPVIPAFAVDLQAYLAAPSRGLHV